MNLSRREKVNIISFLITIAFVLVGCQGNTEETPNSSDTITEIKKTYLMFHSTRDDLRAWYVIDIDSSEKKVQRLSFPKLTGFNKINSLQWIPDLDAFVAELESSDYQTGHYMIKADGEVLHQITSGHNSEISYSNKAKQFLYTCLGAELDICLINADGSNEIKLTPFPSRENDPIWFNSGESVLFVSNRSGMPGIWSIDRDGANLVNLSNVAMSESHPDLSPNGKTIALQSQRDSNWEIYVMNTDGSNPINLTNNSASDITPVWSPDGTFIAFHSDRDNGNDIYVMKADGSEIRNVTKTPNTDERNIVWGLDNSKIYYVAEKDEKDFEIFSVSLDGKDRTNLTNNPADDVSVQWIGQ